MLTTELLEKRITKGRFTMPPLTASHSGYAREPHGGCAGMLYDYAGETYVVPFTRDSTTFNYRIVEAQQVIENPTGYYKDMKLAPVAAGLMESGLEVALKAAIKTRHPKAGKEYHLAFN